MWLPVVSWYVLLVSQAYLSVSFQIYILYYIWKKRLKIKNKYVYHLQKIVLIP